MRWKRSRRTGSSDTLTRSSPAALSGPDRREIVAAAAQPSRPAVSTHRSPRWVSRCRVGPSAAEDTCRAPGRPGQDRGAETESADLRRCAGRGRPVLASPAYGASCALVSHAGSAAGAGAGAPGWVSASLCRATIRWNTDGVLQSELVVDEEYAYSTFDPFDGPPAAARVRLLSVDGGEKATVVVLDPGPPLPPHSWQPQLRGQETRQVATRLLACPWAQWPERAAAGRERKGKGRAGRHATAGPGGGRAPPGRPGQARPDPAAAGEP